MRCAYPPYILLLYFNHQLKPKAQVMATITFDTLKFVEKAGVTREQATAMAEASQDASSEAELATKNDLERIELRLAGQLNTVMGELALVKWMLGVLLAIAIANFAKQFF